MAKMKDVFKPIPTIPTAEETAASAAEFESQQAAEEAALLRQMEATGTVGDDINAEANPFEGKKPSTGGEKPSAVRLRPIRRETIDMAFDLVMKLRTVPQGNQVEVVQGGIRLSGYVDKQGSVQAVWSGLMELV